MAETVCPFNRLRVYLKRTGWSRVHRATTGFPVGQRTGSRAFARITGVCWTLQKASAGFLAADGTLSAAGAGIRGVQWTKLGGNTGFTGLNAAVCWASTGFIGVHWTVCRASIWKTAMCRVHLLGTMCMAQARIRRTRVIMGWTRVVRMAGPSHTWGDDCTTGVYWACLCLAKIGYGNRTCIICGSIEKAGIHGYWTEAS